MDPQAVRCAKPPEIINILKAAQKASGEEAITIQLIDLVDCGSLTPSTFAIWLCIASSPDTLRRALRQEVSVAIRFSAIKKVGKCLRSSQWKETWDGLGGVSGFLSILCDFSEAEVKYSCRVIGSSAKGVDREKKRSFTELYRALQPRIFATPHKVLDERPLQNYYQVLLSACTDDMMDRFVNGDLDLVPSGHWQRLLKHQSAVLQAETLKYVLDGQGPGERWLKPLLSGYPSTGTHVKGFSASMLFSMDVLRGLVKHNHSSLRGGDLTKDLIRPLLKRALRKKVSWQLVEEIVRLSVAMLGRSSAIKELSFERGDVLHMVAQCWSRKPELFEREFRILLASTSKRHKGRKKNELINLIAGIARNRRYAMLEFCFNAIERDLDNAEHLRENFGVIDDSLLSSLPAEAALDLFTRLRSANGDEHLVVFSSPFSSNLRGEPDLWYTILLQRTGSEKDAEDVALRQIEVHKESALTCSTPGLRAGFAKSIINYAIASNSLRLYGKELLWARRYIRDPLVVRTLWGSHVREAQLLLAGVPETHSRKNGFSISELTERINSANQILRELFETVCLALSEPSFHESVWRATLHLPFFVVQERIRRTSDLRKHFGFSDREIYEAMWKDTLETLVFLEKEMLVPGREKLGANNLGGILNIRTSSFIFIDDAEPCTYRFFDQYAKARNELWREFRPTIYPAVTDLPKPFPRGLPIQHLTSPFVLRAPSLEEHAPYIASRLRDAVFPDPTVSLTPIPTDKESKMAIGCFVDDYCHALGMYIPQTLDESTKRQRVERAWAHATGPLSTPRLTPEEARRYWGTSSSSGSNLPENWPLYYPTRSIAEDWPTVPKVDNLLQIEEWNPVPSERLCAEPRQLTDLTYVDILKSGFLRTSRPSVQSMMFDDMVTVPGEIAEDRNLWSYERFSCAPNPNKVREGQILSALLYLDTFNAAHARILSKPFPSSDSMSVRFPALYFDGEWLEKMDLSRDSAIGVLRGHIQHVPPMLLEQVVVNTIDQFKTTKPDAKDFKTLLHACVDLIKLLGESDRPARASSLAIRCIVDHPDASSWHRQLLSQRFLKRLPARKAKACVEEFADAIFSKLEEQEREKAKQKKSTEESAGQDVKQMAEDDKMKQPVVKITTVKFLTELLRGTSFVPEDLSFSILSGLMNKASHMDIRRAGISSLLETLKSPLISSDTVDKIISALKLVIPLAGNLRERDPISASEWDEAEELLRIPEITDIRYLPENTPMLTLLLGFLEPKPSSVQGKYVTRVILPILDSLKQQIARWTSIFLRRQGIAASDIKNLKVPRIPLHGKILASLLTHSSAHVPLSLLEEYTAYLNFNIAPPPTIADVNKRLSADPALSSSNPVQFWLSRYGCGVAIINQPPLAGICLNRLLTNPSQLQNKITPVHIQQNFLKILTLLLWHDEDHLSHVARFMRSLWSISEPTHLDKKWAVHHRPIVEAAIAYMEGLRTRDWEKASHEERRPRFLPDTFEYRMWLLQYACRYAPDDPPPPPPPQLNPDPAATTTPQAEVQDMDPVDAHMSLLVKRVRTITDGMAGTLYHERFARLKQALEYLRNENDERLRFALLLGDIKKTTLSWLSKQDLLRVHLAASLIDGGFEAKDEGVGKAVRAMLEEWKRCESEGVRRLAVKILWEKLRC